MMPAAKSFPIHFMLFSPDYRPITRELFKLTLDAPTPIRSARRLMVEKLAQHLELRKIVTLFSTLALIQLPTHSDLMELFYSISLKRSTRIVSFLAKKAPTESVLPEILVQESYFVAVLGTGHSPALAPDLSRDYDPVKNVWPAALRVAAHSTEWSEFKPTQDDLILNDIVLTNELQGCALDLKKRVHSKRCLSPEITQALASSALGSNTFDLFETDPEMVDMDAEGHLYITFAEDFAAQRNGCLHPAFLIGSVLFPLARFIQRKDLTVMWPGDGDEQKILPVLVDSTPSLFSLQIDFSVWKNGCPKFLLSISTVEGPTLFELAFQGASVVSLVNWVASSNFTLPILYIDIHFNVHVYLLREDDDTFLLSLIASWDLNTLGGLIAFSKALHHFSETQPIVHNRIDQAWNTCASLQMPSLGSGVHGRRVVNSIDVVRFKRGGALRGRRPQEPLVKTGIKLFRCRDDPGGVFRVHVGRLTSIIIKKVRGCSQERSILQRVKYLKDNQIPAAKYIVPLIGSFSMQGDYIVLPSFRPFSEILDHPNLPSIVLRLSYELASGVQFLHTNLIAHLDIKPDNITLTSQGMLQIIDFGLSVFVLSEDETMVGKCGTEGYMAPEIIMDTPYSPIRADRYSCGRVFLFFTELNRKHHGMLTFAMQLMKRDPYQRPPLGDWRLDL